MMDVVYPLAGKSKQGDDWELRYSLRSLAQQPWVNQVFIVGWLPKWVTNVVWIQCPDPYLNCKDANIINKILLACHDKQISDDFVVNSDDQYFLKPVTEDDLIPMIETPDRLSEYRLKAGLNTWHRRVVDSVQWCKKNGYPGWVFQSHSPYAVNKYEFPAVMSQIAWGQGNGYITHIYHNMAFAGDGEPQKEEKGRTLRIKGRINPDELHAQMHKAIFFNHNDAGLQPCVKNYIEQHFPVKSRWER